jgi:hypothetical protein
MSRVEHVRGEFVEFIPKTLENGVLYISHKYKTASHLCCCGCGSKVVTPLKPGGWQLSTKGSGIMLYPSIGSWNLPCQSHYWIRANRIVWAPQWSKAEAEAGRINDQRARERYFDASPNQVTESLWRRIVNWFLQKFHDQEP